MAQAPRGDRDGPARPHPQRRAVPGLRFVVTGGVRRAFAAQGADGEGVDAGSALAQALFEVLPGDIEDWKLVAARLGERDTLKAEARQAIRPADGQRRLFEETR